MEFIKKMSFDFLNKSRISFAVSGLLILACIISLIAKGGPNLGIDFTGGTVMRVTFEKKPDINELRKTLSAGGFSNSEIQNIGIGNSIIIRLKTEEGRIEQIGDNIMGLLSEKFADNPAQKEKLDFVGPAVGDYLKEKALLAIFFSVLAMIIYIAIRFKAGVWGISAVIALVHDVFIVFGIFSIFNMEITQTIIAALLTLAGYSVNDTIVIFDRIRENIRLYRKDDLKDIVNRSMNETLSRTIITSFTTLFPLVALFIFGGEVLQNFSIALIFGIIIGTYSTLFIASPLVYHWNKKENTSRK